MNLANRCRTCLQVINNDSVKIPLNIYEFLEKTLQINLVPRDHKLIELPKNICFSCYEELARFKRFYQLCKDSEEFFKSKIESHLETQTKSLNCKLENASNESAVYDNEENGDTSVLEQIESDKEFLDINHEEHSAESVENDEVHVTEIIDVANDHIDVGVVDDVNADADGDGDEVEGLTINTSTIETVEDIVASDPMMEDDCIAFYEESVDDTSLIEFQVVNSETEEAEGLSIGTVSDLNEKEEQLTIQECEILDYDSYGDESGEHIEITFGDSDFSEQTKETTKNSKKNYSNQTQSKKVYPCGVCGKVFNTGSTLRSHEYIHSDSRPFICDVCGKAFRQGNVLVTHMALHTGKKIECELCGKKFARKSQMILHNRMHKDEKPFICDYPDCNASFRQNQYLMAHKETHSGVRRHQCNLCGRRFFNRPSLLGHMHRVHGSIYYQCDMCVKEFKKSSQIQNHLKTDHQIDVDNVAHLKKRKMKRKDSEC